MVVRKISEEKQSKLVFKKKRMYIMKSKSQTILLSSCVFDFFFFLELEFTELD